MKTVVIIPAYEPDEKLLSLAREILSQDMDVLVMDDGSSEQCVHIFSELESLNNSDDFCVSGGSCISGSLCSSDDFKATIKIIHNEKNLGKGATLKRGMGALSEFFPDAENFITADADGQHLVKDMCRVREMLEGGHDFVITTRILKHDKTPLKSRIGNALSRFFFALANNHYLPDNQSGLRGFNVRHIEWMMNVPGDKYDYELNVLLVAEKQGIKVGKFAIEALYFDNNKNTHFKPFLDTARIYKRFFATEIFALIAILLNIGMVIISDSLFGTKYIFTTCMLCWGVFAIMYFVVERYTIFKNIKYTPGVRRMIFSIFRYAIYSLISFASARALGWSFTGGFIVAMILTSIMEFYILKVSYDG